MLALPIALLQLSLVLISCGTSSVHGIDAPIAGALVRFVFPPDPARFPADAIAYITMTQPGGKGTNTTFNITTVNVPIGVYGLHIHVYGDMTSIVGKAAARVISVVADGIGGHHNPYNTSHGCGVGNVRHIGDIGNVTVTSQSSSTTILVSEQVDLTGAALNNVIGRTAELHEGGDKCVQPGGNPGRPIAQGVIGIINPAKSAIAADLTITTNTAFSQLSQLPVSAVCSLSPTTGSLTYFNSDGVGAKSYTKDPIIGIVRFAAAPGGTANNYNVTMVVSVRGLPPNSVHSLAIHTFGDEMDANAAGNFGSRFNPLNSSVHGLPPRPRFVGDLGNIVADANGNSYSTQVLDLLSLNDPVTGIIGRSLVLREKRDDGMANPDERTGNAIAVGVIGISANDPLWNSEFTNKNDVTTSSPGTTSPPTGGPTNPGPRNSAACTTYYGFSTSLVAVIGASIFAFVSII